MHHTAPRTQNSAPTPNTTRKPQPVPHIANTTGGRLGCHVFAPPPAFLAALFLFVFAGGFAGGVVCGAGCAVLVIGRAVCAVLVGFGCVGRIVWRCQLH